MVKKLERPLAESDLPRTRHVFVLTKIRIVRRGRYTYHVPAGSVVGQVMLSPNKKKEQLGMPLNVDEELVESKDVAVGSIHS